MNNGDGTHASYTKEPQRRDIRLMGKGDAMSAPQKKLPQDILREEREEKQRAENQGK